MARPSPSVFALCKRLIKAGQWEGLGTRLYFTCTYKPIIMPGHIKVPMATPKRHTPLLIPFWKNVNKPQACYTDLVLGELNWIHSLPSSFAQEDPQCSRQRSLLTSSRVAALCSATSSHHFLSTPLLESCLFFVPAKIVGFRE